MGTYLALLRGVNVGGKNSVSMQKLKEALQAAGFAEVRTYINSGNVIFSSGIADQMTLKKICEDILSDAFGVRTAVAVLSAEELREALEHAPDWWGTGSEKKHNAIFVIPPHTAASVMEQVGAVHPDYEQIDSYGQVIFWSAPIKTFSKVRWIKIVSTSAYQGVTIRNSNTAKKLLALVK